MIAHRLSTVRECDRIITIEKGEITESGTHEELIAKGGRYAYLWNSQTMPAARPEQTPLPDEENVPQENDAFLSANRQTNRTRAETVTDAAE